MKLRARAAFPQRWLFGVYLVLGAILVWQLLGIAGASASRNLSFDGAMNLALSRSIAEGSGPRAIYDDAVIYPVGVQSKEPLYVPAAAVFKLFGIGPLQAQLTNLAYFLLMIAVVVALVRRVTDTGTALLAGVLVSSTTSLAQYALNGYGEIPTMFFGVAGLLVVIWPRQLTKRLAWYALAAGILAGLAFSTKFVGIAQVAMISLVLGLRAMHDAGDGRRFRALLVAAVFFAAGALLPLLLVEAARLSWMGRQGYADWWGFQFDSIASQSGAKPRAEQARIAEKIPQHFGILANELRLSRVNTAMLLMLPLAAVGFAFLRRARAATTDHRWLVLGLSFVAVAFFVWWIGFVPTEKAWLRYVYIPILFLAILSAVGIAANFRMANTPGNGVFRLMHLVLGSMLCLTHAPLLLRSIAIVPSFAPSEEVQATRYAAMVISKLPADRTAFGYGWYAAPTVQLYADRAFKDLTDWPIGKLQDQPAYLVADRATLMTGMLKRTLARYPHRQLMRDNAYAQVYEVDFSRPANPFLADGSGAKAHVNFAQGEYSLTSGMEPFDPMGGRFAESDSEVLLRYEGQHLIELTAYMALPRYYLVAEPLRGRVQVGGCSPMPFSFNGTGWQTFRLPLACRLPTGTDVRVRLLLDNVFDLPYVYDRQRAILVQSIGFVD